MEQIGNSGTFDHRSDPNFYADYVEKSASAATLDRFTRVRDKAVKLIALRRPGADKLDVLDIGCGAGTQARLWAALGHRVVGLDVNRPLVEIARTRAHDEGLAIRFDVGSATALPYATDSMDVCLMPELLEHVADWQSCVNEAVRVLRPGGLLYLSTTNALCPRQEEFNLPLYSWYPGWLKRRYEHLAVTSRPELANFARYPAVHWFTIYGLARFLDGVGVSCLDRFELIDTTNASRPAKTAVWAIRHAAPLRFAAHVMTSGTTLFGVKQRSQPSQEQLPLQAAA